jgi:DNA polymerase (family 10)
MVNQEISRLFDAIADALEFKDQNRFRVNAYRRGARVVADLAEDITLLLAEKRLTDVPGIGKGLAADVAEYLSRGAMTALEEATAGIPRALLDLRAIGGLGPKRLAQMHRDLGIRDLASLEAALSSGAVAALPGFGPKLAENIRTGIDLLARNRERMPMAEALALSRRVLDALAVSIDVKKAVFAGSMRRCRETIGDLDLLVPAKSGAEIVRALTRLPGVERVLASGDTKGSVLFEGGRQVDLRVVPPESFGAALCYFTGSKEHNVHLREIAKKQGLKVNEYGVFRGETRVAGKTEEDVYAALGLPWIPAELREDRGEIDAAREGRLPAVIAEKDVRGDLHMHTTWSDGRDSVLEMVRAAKAMGYAYVAVTDHSASAVYANGLTYARWKEQKAEIEAARAAVPGIHVLHGMEVDITADGAIDLPIEAHARLDWIVASVHAGFRNRVTERVLKAMENPHVDAIGHPTGRLIGKRTGYEGYDLEAVIEKAAATGTALELNASPERLDLSAESARLAAERGAPIVINTDAHSTATLEHMALGVRTARRAWLTKDQVVNARPVSRIRGKKRAGS